jgi:hypothetical protein
MGRGGSTQRRKAAQRHKGEGLAAKELKDHKKILARAPDDPI